MKAITGSFTITAVVDGENAVAYEMIDNGSYFRYNPNTKKVDMKVLGTLYKIEGTKRTPMVGYQIFINDDGNIINDNANDSNYLTTKTDGSFSYTADSDWVDLLSQSTKIHAGFYTNDGLVAVLNIQKITDGENGKDGDDAVSIVISPQNIVAKKGVGYQTYSFDVSVVKGGTKIKQGEWAVDYKVNGVYSSSYVIDGVLYFDNVTLKDDYTLHYEFILYPEGVANLDLAFTVNYEGVTYPQSIGFQTLIEPEVYEIVLTNAYCVYNPNEESDNVIGLIEGHLYKVVGDKRVAMSGVSIEYGYSETIGQELDGELLYDTTDTDDDGFFTSGGWFGDTYGGVYVGNSKSIIARYKKDGNVVAQVNVGISQYGMKGERGAPLRISYWEAGWTYYTGKNANDPYTDVVIVGDNYYRCMSNHTATNSNKPVDGSTDKTYWQKSSKIDMIATQVLLAANAHIDLLGSNTINVMDSLGNTTAGMSGGDGVQLWAGGQQESANFRVKKNGDVHVAGYVTAKALYRGFDHVYPVKQRLIKYSDNDAILKEWIFLVSNRGESNPSQADFIIITGDTKDWSASQDASNYHDDDYSDYIKEQGFNNTSCGNVFIPNPTTVEGKEVTIINTVKKNDDSNSSCDILLYAKGGGNNSFYYYRGTTGVSEDLEYISLASIRKIHLVSGRMGTEYAQWIVLDVDEK